MNQPLLDSLVEKPLQIGVDHGLDDSIHCPDGPNLRTIRQMNRLILSMTASLALIAATGCESKPKKGSGQIVVTENGVFLDQLTVVPGGIDVERRKLAEVEPGEEQTEQPADSDQ